MLTSFFFEKFGHLNLVIVEHETAYFTKDGFFIFLSKILVAELKHRLLKHGHQTAYILIDGFCGHFSIEIDEILEREDIT